MFDRRAFIKKSAVWSGYALAAVAIGFPVFSFVGFRKITKKKIVFPPDSQLASVNFKEGAYLLSYKKEFHALSARCPHLGCTVNFDTVSKTFNCPCHGSAFNLSGKWISGPARKNLQPLPIKKNANGDIETVLKI